MNLYYIIEVLGDRYAKTPNTKYYLVSINYSVFSILSSKPLKFIQNISSFSYYLDHPMVLI